MGLRELVPDIGFMETHSLTFFFKPNSLHEPSICQTCPPGRVAGYRVSALCQMEMSERDRLL